MKALKKSNITNTLSAINRENKNCWNRFTLLFANEYAVCTELRTLSSSLSGMAEADDLSTEQHLNLFVILFQKKLNQDVTAITNLETEITELFGKNTLDLLRQIHNFDELNAENMLLILNNSGKNAVLDSAIGKVIEGFDFYYTEILFKLGLLEALLRYPDQAENTVLLLCRFIEASSIEEDNATLTLIIDHAEHADKIITAYNRGNLSLQQCIQPFVTARQAAVQNAVAPYLEPELQNLVLALT